MSQQALWLTEDDVASLVSLEDAIGALEGGLREMGEGQAFNLPKALGGWEDGASSMHSLGSAAPDAGFAGFKNWVFTPRGAKAVYLLFDAGQGKLLAMLEANALGQLRTAAMTGVGTRWLAPQGADQLAIIGSGAQALAQVAAIDAVRPLARIRVWSPTPEKRAAFAARLAEEFDAEVSQAASAEEAALGMPIVTLVTRARAPFFKASMLAPGAHLNAVGAILPHNAEFDPDVFERVGMVAVDDLPNTQKASREFIDHYGKDDEQGGSGWSRVKLIAQVIAERTQRPADCDISLFKSMGMGISDLSVARMAYQRARDAGIGASVSLGSRAKLRWKSAQTA